MANLQKSFRRNAVLEARAHAMRSDMPLSEQILWKEIRACKLGVAFRRQGPVAGQFIADFLAPAARVVIEVDGDWHERRRAADARRDAKLRRAGYRVLRLDAELVMRDLDGALARIRQELATSE
jgi:very-short-patch-repair endonuclease